MSTAIAKPSKFMEYTTVVEVAVGAEECPFLVHESVLTLSSEFLQAAMRSPWKEQREGPIKLKDEDPQLFQMYVHWLYRRKIVIETSNVEGLAEIEANTRQSEDDTQGEAQPEEPEEPEYPEFIILAKALIMGEVLMDDTFMTAIETKFIALRQEGKSFRAGGKIGHFIWTHSSPHSRPRQIIVAQALCFTPLYEEGGFRFNVKRFKEKVRARDANDWRLELYDELILAKVGLGRDPVVLALEILKRPQDMLSDVAPDLKKALHRVQGRIVRPAEEGRTAKRARIDDTVSIRNPLLRG